MDKLPIFLKEGRIKVNIGINKQGMAFWCLRAQQFCLHRFHLHRYVEEHNIVDSMGIRLVWATYSFINHQSFSLIRFCLSLSVPSPAPSQPSSCKDDDGDPLFILPSIPLKPHSPHSLYSRKIVSLTAFNNYLIRNRKTTSAAPPMFLRLLNWPFVVGFRLVYLLGLGIPLLPLLLVPGGMLKIIELAGGTFIKLGQWASTRPDLFGVSLARQLGKLREHSSSHSMHWNKVAVLEDFGLEIEELFSCFSAEPIGSGTIAQVHLAQLRGSSRLVCVKIRHPGVRETFEADLAILKGLFNVVERFSKGAKWLSLSKELESFTEMMMDQLDLRLEGWAMERFHRNFVYPSSPSYVPLPIRSSKRVLVEEWMEESMSMGDFINNISDDSLNFPALKLLSKDLSKKGLDTFLQMLLWDNFVHADLHPGNILIRFKLGDRLLKAPSKERILKALSLVGDDQLETQLCIIDGGMWVEMTRTDWKNFNDLFYTIVIKGDGEEAARLIMERSPTYGDQTSLVRNPLEFKKKVAALIRPFHSLGGTLDIKSLGPLLLRMLEDVQEHHVHLDSSFASLIMSMITIEGIGRQLDPEINLFPHLVKGTIQYLVKRIGGERR